MKYLLFEKQLERRKTIRILLVHKFFHLTGGAELFLFETARILEERGHEIAFFSTIDEKNRQSKYEKYFVRAPDYRGGSLFSRASALCNIVYSKEAKNKFALLLRDFKPDIVHVFAMFTHLSPSILHACRDAGVPVVLSCNDYKHICPNYKLYHHGKLCEACKGGRYYNSVLNKCCHDSLSFSFASCVESYVHHYMDILRENVHTFLFSSEFIAKKTEEFWGKETFRWARFINPFDSTKYESSQDYSDYFLFFGRLVEEKGVDVLLKAMKLTPTARLIIVGDGPKFDWLINFSRELNLNNVEFIGQKWGKDLDELIKYARFVVIPSTWYEVFGYVIVQSFAMGKAVIGTDRGGIPELILNGEFGYIYPAFSSDELSKRITTLWNNPDLAIRMGSNGKLYADNLFNDNSLYETLMGIYSDVVK
jgi:glycosyltransferase involved in cell wall biosynthesis